MSVLFIRSLVKPMSWLPVVLAVLILTGCATVGPDYAPPKKSVSKDWHTQLKGGLTTEEMDPETLAAWWTTLNDPELSSLIDRAVFGNLDLKKARARVREARARRGVAKADLFPTLDATGSATWSRSSKDTGQVLGRCGSWQEIHRLEFRNLCPPHLCFPHSIRFTYCPTFQPQIRHPLLCGVRPTFVELFVNVVEIPQLIETTKNAGSIRIIIDTIFLWS